MLKKEKTNFFLRSKELLRKISVFLFLFLFLFPFGTFSPEAGKEEEEYGSYIIELKKEPIARRKSALKTGEIIALGKIEDNLKLYEEELEKDHEAIKKEIERVLRVGRTGTLGASPAFYTGKEFKYLINGIVVDNISKEDVERIEEIEGVKGAWENKIVKVLLADSVPLMQGGIEAGKLDEDGNYCTETGKLCLDGQGTKIAIIDTGVDYTHSYLGGCTTQEFLEGHCAKVIGGYDFVDENSDPMDVHGHGTHVASISAGNGTLNGVAPGASVLAYRVLNEDGSGYWSWIISGIEEAVLDGADVLNLSLGSPGDPDDPLSSAVDNAVLSGVVAVVSAGNSGPGGNTYCRENGDGSENSICSPGTARNAITIGATDKDDVLASFSSRGPVRWNGKEIMKPDIVAPGVFISAAKLNSGHALRSGTSMSAPHVAGAVALLKQKNSKWTPAEIKDILKEGAVDLGYEEKEQGEGRADTQRTLRFQQEYTLTINTDGSGSVSKNPDKITYNYEEEVILTANADAGWTFSHWSGDLSGSNNPKTITMNDDKTVTAHFTQDAYTLTINVVGEGSVSKDPDQPTYLYGEEVTLTADPALSWTFSHWTGDLTGFNNPETVTMDGNKEITAHFELEDEYTLTVSIDGGGSVTKNPDKASYTSGEEVTLTATADPGWTFSNWSGDLTGVDNPNTIIMDSNKGVIAHFTQDAYTLTVNIEGSGAVEKSPLQSTYTYGTEVTLTATADPGWTFSNWSGDLTGVDNPKTITMNDDKTVTAHFTQDVYTLTINVVGEGSVSKDPDQPTYLYGGEVTLTADPAVDWNFSHWAGDLEGSENPKVITMDDDKTVTAHFTQNEHTLSIIIDGEGSVAKSPDKAVYAHEDMVELTATADPGWTFSNWSGDLTGVDNPNTITMDGSKEVTAHFTQDEYTLSIIVDGEGDVIKDPDQVTYLYGTEVTLTAVVDEGHSFSHWSGDLSGSDTPVTITMNGNKEITAHFKKDTAVLYELSLSVSPSEAGSVSGEGLYKEGEVVEIMGTANTGYQFINWTGDTDYVDNVQSATANVTMPAKDIALTANFKLKEHTLSITVDGSGSVTKNPEEAIYLYGTEVALTAVADSGWAFSNWSGDLTGSENPVNLTMNNNKEVTVVFSRTSVGGGGGGGGTRTTSYSITLSVNDENMGKVEGAGTYSEGREITVRATPEDGYRFLRWEEDGETVSRDAEYVFIVESARSLKAIFIKEEEAEVAVEREVAEIEKELQELRRQEQRVRTIKETVLALLQVERREEVKVILRDLLERVDKIEERVEEEKGEKEEELEKIMEKEKSLAQKERAQRIINTVLLLLQTEEREDIRSTLKQIMEKAEEIIVEIGS